MGYRIHITACYIDGWDDIHYGDAMQGCEGYVTVFPSGSMMGGFYTTSIYR